MISRRTLMLAGTAALLLPMTGVQALSRRWYVDNAVALSGNGLSWQTAWKNPVNIEWGLVSPGDTIFVSGGPISKTYSGLFEIARSGAPGSPILVTPGVDAGHNGQVIFDFGRSADSYVYLRNCSHVVFQGFSLRNGGSGAVAWLEELGGGVLFQHNVVETGTGGGNGNARGIDIRRCEGRYGANIVRNNTISTTDSSRSQTDGIYSMDNGHNALVIEGNSIVVNNRNDAGHSDCFQSYRDGSMVVSNNLFQSSRSGRDNHAVWIADIRDGGTLTFSDNRSVSRNGASNVTVWRSGPDAGNGAVRIERNEIVGGSRALNFERLPDVEINRNVVRPDPTGVAYFMAITPLRPRNVERNEIHTRRVANVLGSTKTWQEWQRMGYDANGLCVDRPAIG